MKKVSIVVPVYMVEEYLQQCVESILAQTYDNLEIILVDDGSRDQCGEIADRFAALDNRIYVIHKQNGGLVSARKAGIEYATGECVVYVDGDDWVEPTFVSSLVEIIEREKADVVTSGYFRETERNFDTIPTGVYQTVKEKNLIYENMLSTGRFYTFGILPFLWNKIYRRDLLLKFQSAVDERISVGEDVCCLYPLLLSAKKIVVSGLCGYHYRTRNDSLTSNHGERVDETEQHLLLRYRFLEDCFHKDANWKKLKTQLNQYMYFNLLMKYPEKLFSSDEAEYMPLHIKKGESVAIYGMGQFGRKLMQVFKEQRFCKVLFQTDKFAYQLENGKYTTELSNGGYDKVVVATWQECLIREIKEWLSVLGVPSKKIAEVDYSEKNIEGILEEWRISQ